MDGEAIEKKRGVSRRGFLTAAGLALGTLAGVGALMRRKGKTPEEEGARIFGIEADSLFMPRRDQLERFLRDR